MRWQHFDELEADFYQYYNLDVACLKPAKAARLLFQLPSNCRTFVAIHPQNKWDWNEVLINKANYLLEVLAWQKANEGVKASQQTDKPKLFIPAFMEEKKPLDPDIEVRTTDDIKDLLAMPRGE